jgi:hypothetical protein
MCSRFLKFGAAALTLALPLTFTSGAEAHTVHTRHRHAQVWDAGHDCCRDPYAYYRHLGEYRVMVRDCSTAPWRVYGRYGGLGAANHYADQLRCQGYATQVVCP